MRGELKRQRVVAHPPEKVWRALTRGEAIRSWLGDGELVAGVGHTFQLTVPGPLGRPLEVTGTVLEVHPPHRLVLSWKHEGVASTVIFEVEPVPQGARVVVRHRGLTQLSGILVAVWMLFRWDEALAAIPGVRPRTPLWVAATGGAVTTVATVALLWASWPIPGSQTPRLEASATTSVGVAHSEAPLPPTPATAVPHNRFPPAAHTEPREIPGDTTNRSTTEALTSAEPTAVLERPRHNHLPALLSRLAHTPPGTASPRAPAAPPPSTTRTAPPKTVEPTGTLRLQTPHLPSMLNPLFAQSASELLVQRMVYDKLFEQSKAGPVSHVVEAYTAAPDGRSITVSLRRDVRWHSGEKLDAQDVCATIGWFTDPSLESPHYAHWSDRIASCSVSGREATIGLTRAWADPREALDLPLMPGSLPSPPARDSWASSRPIGTGPMSATRGTRGVHLRAARHASRQPHLAEIVVSAGQDPHVQARQLALGEVDAIAGFDGQHLELLDPSTTALYPISVLSPVVAFDTQTGVTRSPHLREALVALLHGEPAEEALGQAGAVQLQGRWVLNRSPLRIRMGVHWTFDEARAREIQNRWSAAGLEVQIDRLGSERLANSEQLRETHDVVLYTVDMLQHQHPLQPLVQPGAGNPFGTQIAAVESVLHKRGDEHISDWLALASLLEAEHAFELLQSRSTWLAVGPHVDFSSLPPSHPEQSLSTWALAR